MTMIGLNAAPAFVAVNPTESQPAEITVPLAELGLRGKYAVRDLWACKNLGIVAEDFLDYHT
jgi:hypothetical protein